MRGVYPREDFAGKILYQLKVIKLLTKRKRGHRMYLCECKCGKSIEVSHGSLNGGNTKSCGCRRLSQKGLSSSIFYGKWRSFMKRCYLPSDPSYEHYGKRGITVCNRWHNFQSFFSDMNETYFTGATIERNDVNKGYSPENCRWATLAEQNRNRTDNIRVTLNGETKTLGEWADVRGVKRMTAYWRNKRGLPLKAILSTTRLTRSNST